MCEERLKEVRLIQLAEIELIKHFVQICEKEHLTYYMLGGTMLGAVRHKGYIPWDDDTDFGMPREDYETFLKVAGKYLTDGIQLSTFNGESHYKYVARLLNSNKIIKIGGVMTEHECNPWIDIFPLDGMPEDPICRFFHKIRLLTWRKIFRLSNFEKEVPLYTSHRTWYNRIGTLVCKHIPFYRLIPKDKAWGWIDKALKAYPYAKSTWNLNMMGAYRFRELFKQSVFGEGAFYEFEGMELRGAKDYNSYLTQLYGDYMTPLPESEWNSHHTELMEE